MGHLDRGYPEVVGSGEAEEPAGREVLRALADERSVQLS